MISRIWTAPPSKSRAGLMSAAALTLGALGLPALADDERPGRAGKFNQDVVAMVEKAQISTANQPNSWDWFVGLADYSRRLTQDAYATPDAGGIRNAPEGWPKDSSWPIDPSEIINEELAPIVVEAIRGFIAMQDEAGVYDQLDEFRDRRRFIRPLPDGKLMEVILPELGHARALARLCGARLVLAARDGNQGECVRSFEHGLALSRPMAHQFTLIDHLVSIAIQALMLNRAQELALDGKLSASTIRAMITSIDRDSIVPDPLMAMRGEHFSFRDMVEWTHTDSGGDGKLIEKELRAVSGLTDNDNKKEDSLLERLLGPAAPSKKETLAKGQEIFDQVFANAAMPYRERLGAPSADEMIGRLPKHYTVLRIMLPALERALSSYDNLRQDRAAAKLLLAIVLDHATYNEYPVSLEKLRAKPLAELKIDPLWLAEFRYEVIPAQAGRPVSFKLYALGRDGQDNHGKAPKDGRHMAMNKGHEGTDRVYAPREKGR